MRGAAVNQSSSFKSLLAEDILEFPLTGIHLIEASAGTGKTYTIASLFVRYLLAGISIDKILVVTFTNAATEELRGRIRARIFELLQLLQKPLPCDDQYFERIVQQCTDRKLRQQAIDRLKLALRTMDEAAIYTIHGFCQRVLNDHAFNSGQAYDTELIPEQNEIGKQTAEDWWRKQATELSQDQMSLFSSALISLDDFCGLQAPLLTIHPPNLRPQIDGTLQDFYQKWNNLKPDIRKLADIWKHRAADLIRILNESGALARNQTSPYKKERLEALIDAVNDEFSAVDPRVKPAVLSFLGSHSINYYSKPSKRGKDPELDDPFFNDCQRLTDRINELLSGFRIRALSDATHYTRKQIEAIKIKRRVMTYDDLLTRVYEALCNSRSKTLVQQLRQSFPVAMIDEFQDTDAIQYGIFRKIYSAKSETALTLIGDPKQSIYSFRGSDIFVYMRARKDAENQGFTLDTNRRSTPGLIKAVNTLFSLRKAPFIYHRAIRFSEMKHAIGDKNRQPTASHIQGPAVTLWKIPLDSKQKPYTTEKARQLLADATAVQIATFFDGSSDHELDASDIAVLVRTNREGEMIHTALRNHGVAAVTMARDNIFEGDEAYGLEMLLMAIAEPTNQQRLRNAMSSALLDMTYSELDRIRSDEHEWQNWTDQLRALNHLWRNKGFMVMFQHMLDSLNMGERITDPLSTASRVERRLTNLMHLGEMLQQASKKHPSPSTLLAWFIQQREQAVNQEAEPRLESDDALVKIVTIHSSKGLEYPIVFLPFVWSCRPIKDTGTNLIGFHDDSGNAWLDAGSAEPLRHQALCSAEKERLAEDLRLLYVALTRAKSKIYMAWGPVKSGQKDLSGKSALAYLLHSDQSPGDLNNQLPEGFRSGIDWDNCLSPLAEKSEGTIKICELPTSELLPNIKRNAGPDSKIQLNAFMGDVANDWRIASFTGMTRTVHQPPHHGSPIKESDPILNFPAGSRTGTFIHLVLENLDFQGDIELQANRLWEQFSPRFNFDNGLYRETLIIWLKNIVETPLDSTHLKLTSLSNNKRLNELEFDFSVSQSNFSALNRLLKRHTKTQGQRIDYENFQGVVNGIIDLVFEHQGRFYIADYKTNFLGGALDDYLPEKLSAAITDRCYDLQSLLYTLAVHRYLKQRIPKYCYQEHFGGVFTLFLRAMRANDRRFRGIYQVLPDKSTLKELDKIVFPSNNPLQFSV